MLWHSMASAEAEFLDKIQTKILRVFLLAIHSHPSTLLCHEIYLFKLTQPLTLSYCTL
jgi:hypothetical protein